MSWFNPHQGLDHAKTQVTPRLERCQSPNHVKTQVKLILKTKSSQEID